MVYKTLEKSKTDPKERFRLFAEEVEDYATCFSLYPCPNCGETMIPKVLRVLNPKTNRQNRKYGIEYRPYCPSCNYISPRIGKGYVSTPKDSLRILEIGFY